MPQYIQREVEDLRDDPTKGEIVELLVGVKSSAATEDITGQIEAIGGELVEKLPFDSLLVRIPEEHIGDLCTLDAIESVERDEGMEVLTGN